MATTTKKRNTVWPACGFSIARKVLWIKLPRLFILTPTLGRPCVNVVRKKNPAKKYLQEKRSYHIIMRTCFWSNPCCGGQVPGTVRRMVVTHAPLEDTVDGRIYLRIFQSPRHIRYLKRPIRRCPGWSNDSPWHSLVTSPIT